MSKEVWVEVRALPQRGRWRCGILWSHNRTYRRVPVEFVPRLQGDPMLGCVVVESPPPGWQPDGSYGLPESEATKPRNRTPPPRLSPENQLAEWAAMEKAKAEGRPFTQPKGPPTLQNPGEAATQEPPAVRTEQDPKLAAEIEEDEIADAARGADKPWLDDGSDEDDDAADGEASDPPDRMSGESKPRSRSRRPK